MSLQKRTARKANPGGSESLSDGKIDSFRVSPKAGTFQLPSLDSSHVDLDTLERMSLWRLDLGRRLWQVQIRFELADCELPELHDLAREARDFAKCVRALKWGAA